MSARHRRAARRREIQRQRRMFRAAMRWVAVLRPGRFPAVWAAVWEAHRTRIELQTAVLAARLNTRWC